MPELRKAVDGPATAIMLLLCFIWGMQQVAIKFIAGDVSTTLQVALRSGIAAVLVWCFSRVIARERWLPGIGTGPGLVVGALFALEFLLIAQGLHWTTASHMAVFLYTAPMFAAMGLHVALPAERLSRVQWVGIGIAFVGILVAFLAPDAHSSANPAATRSLLGDLMGLAAGIAWGLTTVAVRTTRLSEAPAAQTLFWQLGVAAIVLLPFAALTGQWHFHARPVVLASLAFQTVVVAFVSYLVWFWMLRRYLAARLGVLALMTPLFGVALGALLLHEALEASFIAGAALVLAGMLLVNGAGWMKFVFARRSVASGSH